VGVPPPLGPPEYPVSDDSLQRSASGRLRRCLLKRCERLFEPTHVHCRYCGQECQAEARDWQRWRAAYRYRSTPDGQERRRAQNRRYRERQRQRRVEEAARLAQAEAAAEGREGQLKEGFSEDCGGTPCDRPGCYVLFQPRPHEPAQRFCCPVCRRALWRVFEREARWQRRRERGVPRRPRPPLRR